MPLCPLRLQRCRTGKTGAFLSGGKRPSIRRRNDHSSQPCELASRCSDPGARPAHPNPTETHLDLFGAGRERPAADRQTGSLNVTLWHPFVVRAEVAGFHTQSLAALGI